MKKGFTRLVSCFKTIKNYGIDSKLVIVGDGEERATIENEIRSNHMEDSVVLVGYSDNPYPYIKNSMFLVCSSYSEGMPVVVMEALCLGVPVVSSYKPAEELFDSLPCGIATEVDDDSLTQGMMNMFDDNFRITAINAALSRRKYFLGKNLIEKVEEIYDSL